METDMEPADTAIEPDQLLPEFEGRDCNYCKAGTLTQQTYKGSPAVVCTECAVPQVRFF